MNSVPTSVLYELLFLHSNLKYSMSFDHPTVKPEPRTLTVCPSCRGLPRIVLSGEWVRQWGFEIGDALLASYAGPGALLLKIHDTEDGRSFPASNLPQTPHPVSKTDAIKLRLHPTQVRTPHGRLPKITITGAWLHDWKIRLGDRVSVTRTDEGNILIQVQTAAPKVREIKVKKRLQDEVAHALATLDSHKAAHPELYPDNRDGWKAYNLKRQLIDGLKESKSTVLDLLFRNTVLSSERETIHNSEEAYQSFLKCWAPDSLLQKEEYKVALRNVQGELLAIIPITQVENGATQPNLALALAVSILGVASNIILVHNHPNGPAEPDEDDIAIAQKLKERAAPLDIQLSDSLIIAPEGYYSFADKGQL
jgi:DNA repair protein RadC